MEWRRKLVYDLMGLNHITRQQIMTNTGLVEDGDSSAPEWEALANQLKRAIGRPGCIEVLMDRVEEACNEQ